MKLLLATVIGLTACGAANQKSGCTDLDLAKIEAAYVAEVLTACKAYETPEECPDYFKISRKYDGKREDYIQCQ